MTHGPHAAGRDSSNFTLQALAALKANHAKGAFFVQMRVSYRGGSERGREVIARIHQDGHIVGIYTGSDQDYVSHVERQQSGNLAGDLDRTKARLTDLGISPEFVRPVGGATNAEVLEVYQQKGLRDEVRALRYSDCLEARSLAELFLDPGIEPHASLLLRSIVEVYGAQAGNLLEELLMGNFVLDESQPRDLAS